MEVKKVLVVDDDQLLRDALKIKLEMEGFLYQSETNGEDGIKAIKEFKPDVVLLDIDMPRMGGVEVLKKLKEEKIEVNVIMLTNDDETDSLATALEHGVKGYLIKKDWSINSVVEKIRSI